MTSIEKDALKSLRNLTECCICLMTYTDPRTLPCLHTCCLKCFEDIQIKNEKTPCGILPCPLCRKEFTIPTEGMKGLQKNFFIENLIETTKILKSSTERLACSNCSLVEEAGNVMDATMRCLNCSENYCLRCSKIHQGQKLTKEHRIVEIQSCHQDEDIRNLFPIRNCNKHSDKALDYYCSDCKTVVCVSCFVEVHKLHECKDMKTVDKNFRKTLEMNCANISEYSDKMLSKKIDLERQKKEYLEQIFVHEQAIMTKSQQLKEMIDRHAKILLDELLVMKLKHQKIFETEFEEIERKITVVESFVTYCSEIRSNGSSSEVCGSFDNLIERAKEISEENDKYLSTSRKSVEIEFRPTDQNSFLHDISNVIGSLSDSLEQFENCAVVIGFNGVSSTSEDFVQINLNQSENVSKLASLGRPTKFVGSSAAAVYSNAMFVTGIGHNEDEIWRFDAASSNWSQCSSLVRGRNCHSVAFMDHVLFVCGGYSKSDRITLDDVEAYDTIANKCEMVGKLDKAVLMSGNCVSFEAKLYIFGGYDDIGEDVNDVQVYDTKSNTCSLISEPMPSATYPIRAVAFNNFVILINCYGGILYNFYTETCLVRSWLKTDVDHFGLVAANGKLFVVGGGYYTSDKAGESKWICRDDVRWIPIANILDDRPIEWKLHSRLPKPTLIFAYGNMDFPKTAKVSAVRETKI